MHWVLTAAFALLVQLGPAMAQTQGPAQQPPNAVTLEDIRLDLEAIDAQVQALRAQLSDTGQTPPAQQGPALTRLDTLESRLRQLTGRVEQLQNDVRRMAEDAGRRYSDVEFRLTEIEGGEVALLGDPVPLGGGLTPGPGPASSPTVVEVAVSERNSYDQAAAFVAEDPALAETRLTAFLASYPDSPLTADAHLGLAASQEALGRRRDAARSYLAAFSAAPDGPRAAEALLGVGVSLRLLGQLTEACLTYDEVSDRFPAAGPDIQAALVRERTAAACS